MGESKQPFWDPDEPGIFDDPEAVARADARAIADIEAGRVVDHEVVIAWLRELAAGRRPPAPQSGK